MNESKGKSRIGMLITELEFGGAEQRFCDVACGLDSDLCEVEVCSLGPAPAAPKDQLVRRLQSHGIEPHFLGLQSAWQLPSAIRRVRSWIADRQIDVLQCFLFHANVVGGWAAPRRVPLSLSLRVADPRKLRILAERSIAKKAARVVCVSERVRDFACSAGYPADKMAVIANGVDVSVASVPAPANEPPMIVFVGRLDPQKGIDWLIDNAREWLQGVPTARVRVVGDGPLHESLLATIERLGLNEQIRLTGWSANAREQIAAADLLVLPSRWEGMPNVVMEAMAAGKPVLCAAAEGVRELLGENANGQLAEFGAIDQWAQQTNLLLTDPQRRRELGTANQQRITQHFSRSRMVDDFQRLFLELAKIR